MILIQVSTEVVFIFILFLRYQSVMDQREPPTTQVPCKTKTHNYACHPAILNFVTVVFICP